jgi:hypothetical protein
MPSWPTSRDGSAAATGRWRCSWTTPPPRSTALLKILGGAFLGVRQVPITYEVQGETRIVKVEKIIDGAITPVKGKDRGNVVIRNSEYWIAPDIIVAQADRSRFRLFGRNWNFAGRSAEICRLDWGNQR